MKESNTSDKDSLLREMDDLLVDIFMQSYDENKLHHMQRLKALHEIYCELTEEAK
jgi:hypothetical protein